MSDQVEQVDLLIVGAGPTGIQAACTAQDLGLSYRVIDQRGLAHSFVDYPHALRFFSPPDEMAVGGVPFPMRGGEKPAREDILAYFRAVAAFRKLELSLWERIIEVRRDEQGFAVRTSLEPNGEAERSYGSSALLLASGIWDETNRLTCPGADLPHVTYRFHEPTEYFGQRVVVAGGGNSAVHAALTLAEAHAEVTLVMRRPPVPYQSHLRPFVVRDLEFAVEEHRLTLHTPAIIGRIEPGRVQVQPADYEPDHEASGQANREPFFVNARFVFALLGQRPGRAFLESLGLCLEPDGRPTRDPETFETNIPGLYVAGSLAGAKIDIILTAREQTADVVRRIASRIRP